MNDFTERSLSEKIKKKRLKINDNFENELNIIFVWKGSNLKYDGKFFCHLKIFLYKNCWLRTNTVMESN